MNQRELKFRAYHYPSKKMFWFDLMWGNKATIGGGYIAMLPIGEEREYGNRENRIAVDPEDCRILQYTGITDVDGKEIYEGDILEANGRKNIKTHDYSDARKYVSAVIKDSYEQINGRFRFKIVWGESFLQWNILPIEHGTYINTDVSNRDYKVIGNIYENPELCEKI